MSNTAHETLYEGPTRPSHLARAVGTALLALGTLGLVACGSDDTSSDSATGEPIEGEIAISGSSTVEPITIKVGEKFADARGLVPDVEGPGTGDGFKKFCAGETDISNASRLIKDEEKAACSAAGIDYVELAIGQDALTVMTSEKNTAVTCLTLADLYGLVGPESEGVTTWADASEFGATTELPDADLKIIAPGTESGTYDSFWELAVKKIAEERLGKDKAEAKKLRGDYGGLANDNEIVSGIADNATSLGWAGFAFADQAEGVSEIEIDGGEGCVAPSPETVTDGTYPLSRTLYIYVNKAKIADNPAVKPFVDFYLSDEGLASVAEADYIALDDAALAETRSTWDAASKG